MLVPRCRPYHRRAVGGARLDLPAAASGGCRGRAPCTAAAFAQYMSADDTTPLTRSAKSSGLVAFLSASSYVISPAS